MFFSRYKSPALVYNIPRTRFYWYGVVRAAVLTGRLTRLRQNITLLVADSASQWFLTRLKSVMGSTVLQPLPSTSPMSVQTGGDSLADLVSEIRLGQQQLKFMVRQEYGPELNGAEQSVEEMEALLISYDWRMVGWFQSGDGDADECYGCTQERGCHCHCHWHHRTCPLGRNSSWWDFCSDTTRVLWWTWQQESVNVWIGFTLRPESCQIRLVWLRYLSCKCGWNYSSPLHSSKKHEDWNSLCIAWKLKEHWKNIATV